MDRKIHNHFTNFTFNMTDFKMSSNISLGLVFEVPCFCELHCNNYRSTAKIAIVLYEAYAS